MDFSVPQISLVRLRVHTSTITGPVSVIGRRYEADSFGCSCIQVRISMDHFLDGVCIDTILIVKHEVMGGSCMTMKTFVSLFSQGV